MAYTKEAQIAQTFTKEEMAETGTPLGEFGLGIFGTSVFSGTKGRKWERESQSSQSYSKEEQSEP